MGTDADHPALLCPRCGYDVAQTRADGFDTCPECGGEADAAYRVHEGVRRTQKRTTALCGVGLSLCFALTPLVAIGVHPGAGLIVVVFAFAGLAAGMFVVFLSARRATPRVLGPAPALTRAADVMFGSLFIALFGTPLLLWLLYLVI